MAVSCIAAHASLQGVTHPVLSIMALYVLTGCDYTSSFFLCTKSKFMDTFIDNISFICSGGSLAIVKDGVFRSINTDAWIRLTQAVYYSKYKKFFRSKSIELTHNLVYKHPDSKEAQRMFTALGFPANHQIQTLSLARVYAKSYLFHRESN